MSAVDLHGKTALVTGAGTRLGAAISRALAAAGCDLVVHYGRSEEGARAVARDAEALGRKALLHQADLTDRAQIDRLAERALAEAGRIDVLVHNAGRYERVAPADLAAEHLDRMMEINVTAPYLLTLALAPALRRAGGSVIAITDIAARRPWKNYVPYSVSKAALASLVEGLARALAPEVRVNAVAPGAVLPPEDYDEDKLARLRAPIPLARFGEADDVARAVVFLAQNDYLSGQTIAVDGGRSVVG
jgi:pteridine reductase